MCSASTCKCPAIQNAMGREVGAMCHEGRRRSLRRRQLLPTTDALLSWHSDPLRHDSVGSGYWNCTSALEQVCPFDRYRHDPTGCTSCAATNMAALEEAGCDDGAIAHGCNGNYENCFRVLDGLCSQEKLSSPTSCQACAHSHTSQLEDANCTQFFINYECDDGHHHHENEWEAYIDKLACHLNGTWYSTREEGECKSAAGAANESCLWKVKAKGRTVNASCVDGAVISAVKKSRPDCFKHCPQPTNVSSACYLHCLFDTMVGNDTATPPVPAIAAADIVDAFTKSFADEASGGCPSVSTD
eukprot:SAG31_NODE_2985_length_4812_cov_3.398517_3_plen_301_part_00